MFTRRPLAGIAVAATLVAATSCSGSDPETLTAGGPNASAVESTPASTTRSISDPPSLPLAEFEHDNTAELREFVAPALGGVRFSVSTDHTPAIIDDTILVFTDPPNPQINGPRSRASIALTTQSVAGSAVLSVEEFLETVEGVADAVVKPTGDAIELFGRRLRGYEVSNDAELDEPTLFSSVRLGAPVDTEFGTFPYALIYLTDTPAGVLTAGVYGSDEANARQSSVALGTLLATFELTGPGLDAPLPSGEAIGPTNAGPVPEPASLLNDAPPAMETAFAPIESGPYQLPNIGRQLTVDIEDGWFAQPNFPGIVVLTAPGSIGPGDRDLVMISDVVEYLPTEAGPHRSGESVRITSVEALTTAPPAGFRASQVTNVKLGGLSAAQFDLISDPAATCTLGAPCEAALITSYGFVKQLAAGFDHRIWWIEHETGPATVFIAMALADTDFIKRATTLVESIDIS